MDQSKSVKNKLQSNSNQLSNGEFTELLGKGQWKNLFAQVDISTLVLCRIFFGVIMLYEVYRYFSHNWIHKYWIDPKYHFTYWPFDFLTPLPGNGMYILFYVMGVLSLFITIGFLYRISIIAFFLCFTYMFLLEGTQYLNHFYLVSLFSFVMIFLPLNRSASIDAIILKKQKSETCPAWCLWLVRFMVAIPYFFGGIAKINPDWLRGQPLGMWLANSKDFPIIGPYFGEHWMIFFMSYSGLLLDLLIIPLFLFKKTRFYGMILISSFHLMNSQLFQIGIFPWFMIATTAIFFDPSWPRKLINKWFKIWPLQLGNSDSLKRPQILSSNQKLILTALSVWFLIHTFLPFRHHLFPGNVSWTEEGHRYAWHMKLRTKQGHVIYTVKDKNSDFAEMVNAEDYLTARQSRKIEGRPYFIWQFCQIVKKEYAEKGMDVEVYANLKASLNGRDFQQLIDPTVDLGAVPRPLFKPSPWIVPLNTPLKN